MALISVIITTKNEESNIQNCLESISGQSFPFSEIEVLVVDNNSTDKTLEIVQEYMARPAPLNIKLFNWGPERSAQKNYGVKKSQGEYFIHLDADMTLGREVICECVDKMTDDPDLVGLYIPEIVMGEKYLSRVRKFERSFYDGTIIDGLRFIQKDKFLEAGKFDENLYACEDWDLDKRLKKLGRASIVSAILYHNESDFSLKNYLAKKEYYSKNFEVYISKWGKNDPDIRRQFGFYYRFIGVFVEDGKWKELISHPVLALGMYWLRFLVGLNYLTMSFPRKRESRKLN
jgi:glycosyltransferase involved in cell wall biosynthesis